MLVNNAALTYYIPIQDYPVNRWVRSWAVNLHAPFILSKLVLEDMIPRKGGSIVNISSGAAVGPGRGPYRDPAAIRGGTCYGAEKAALERFTQGLAEEVYAHGISVTALSPSQVVPTPGTVHHKLVRSMDDPRGEPPILMARAALLLATGARCRHRRVLQPAILKGSAGPTRRRAGWTAGSGYADLRGSAGIEGATGSPGRDSAWGWGRLEPHADPVITEILIVGGGIAGASNPAPRAPGTTWLVERRRSPRKPPGSRRRHRLAGLGQPP